MRIFIAVLVMIFGLQSWTKADDIGDFEIEGISIGDSALDFVNKKFIEDEKYYYPASKKFVEFNIDRWNLKSFNHEIYDSVHINYKNNDSKYISHSIRGKILYRENISECAEKKKKIIKDVEKLFSILKRTDDIYPHSGDKTGNSIADSTFLYLDNGGRVSVQCYDWSEDMKKWDNLSVSISNKEFVYWLDNEAF